MQIYPGVFNRMSGSFIYFIILNAGFLSAYNWDQLNLSPSHLPFYFKNNPGIEKHCQDDVECPYQVNMCTPNFIKISVTVCNYNSLFLLIKPINHDQTPRIEFCNLILFFFNMILNKMLQYL